MGNCISRQEVTCQKTQQSVNTAVQTNISQIKLYQYSTGIPRTRSR